VHGHVTLGDGLGEHHGGCDRAIPASLLLKNLGFRLGGEEEEEKPMGGL